MTDLPDGDDPWTTLSTREVYRNPWIRVREDEVVRADGSEGIYGVVEAKLAVGVVALTADDEVVLVGQWRYPLGHYSWEIVEGGVDDGESAEEGIARELAEEAGLVAGRWTHLLGPVALSNSFTAEVGHLWLAEDLSTFDGEVATDPTEELAVARVPLADALTMVDDGRIDDALTVMGLYALDRRRRRDDARREPPRE